jgi:hypothetical protein
MYNLRPKQNLIFLIFIAVFAFFVLTEAKAFVRPPNPTMNYVPQNIGIYDTYYENLKESDCRACHGASVTERHHGTENALMGNCFFCHLGFPFSETTKDCTSCHVDGGLVGNFGFPHHRSDLAESGQCNQCHMFIVETNTVATSGFSPTSSTPTPFSCENCHWPSGSSPHKPPEYSDWKSWTGTPKPTSFNGIENPQPIEANGLFYSGSLGERPYMPTDGTHHMVGGNVYPKCYNCHASSPGSTPNWDPNNPYLIRYCENCHSADKLHAIPEHVTDNNIYRVGVLENTLVTAIEKCIACHGTYMLEPPPLPADTPVIGSIRPKFGPPGIIVNIKPASGACFNEDPVNGLCSFGQKLSGDRAKMGQKDSMTGDWQWFEVPLYSWSEHLIQIRVPDNTFQPGKTKIKLLKEDVGESNYKVFNVREHPVISSLNPTIGNWGQAINIDGAGFGIEQEEVYPDGYGYSTYIKLLSSGNKYRVTIYKDVDPSLPGKQWDQNTINIKLNALLDINAGNLISMDNLNPGCWDLYVVTDYFKDDGDSKYFDPITGKLNKHDALLYSDISNSVCFKVTKDPYINSINPNPALPKETAKIYGSNFGSYQGTSKVKVWNDAKTDFKLAEIISWSKTEIMFVVPEFGTDPTKYPKKKWVQVKVPIAPEPNSNYYRLIIPSPGP